MRTKACLLLIVGFLFFVFSKAEASITWLSDSFDYNTTDRGGFYYNGGGPPVSLVVSSEKSDTNGDSENSAVATATESQAGLTMASGAWGNSFQNLEQDSGGATVYGYADNSYALDDPLGVCQNGQKVSSFISRLFTVSSTGNYAFSASAVAPLDWSGTTTGTAVAPKPQLTGEVQIFQTDSHQNTTTVLDSERFSLSSLAASSQQATLTLVAGDTYQLVVAFSGVTNTGGRGSQPGVMTSFNNLDPNSLASQGNIDGDFNVGTETKPVTITASLSPTLSLWQNAVDLGKGWKWLQWFGTFNTDNSPWIYHQTLGWLYAYGTTQDSIWFWDDTMNAFWWTSQTVYPYMYRASDGAWLFYEQGSSNPRWFYNYSTGKWERD